MKGWVNLLLLGPLNLLMACNRTLTPGQEPAATLISPSTVAKGPSVIQVPFELVNNVPVVQATVDERSGNFVLDTGAEELLLNEGYFKGTPTAVPLGAGATGGFKHSSIYRVSTFNWHGIAFQNADVTAIDLNHLGNQPLLGLIGADLLTPYAVTLDYPKRMLTLRTPGSPVLTPPRDSSCLSCGTGTCP